MIYVSKRTIIRVLFICLATALALPSQVRGTITDVEKNLLPAILSYDYSTGVLGLGYGVDHAYPTLTTTGTIDGSGFAWTAVGDYLGSRVSWASTGTYNSGTDSTHWTGAGSYLGEDWSMSGDIVWLSDTEFKVAHEIWIGTPGEFGIETEDWDEGTYEHGTHIRYKIDWSSNFWYKLTLGIFGKKYIDQFDLWIDDGTIVENTLTYNDPITVSGDGTITISGGSFSKTITITPEPATITLLGLGSLALVRRRRKA